MRSRRMAVLVGGPTALLLFLLAVGVASGAGQLTDSQQLGRSIFFDAALSIDQNQSCASCHDPAWGWTGPSATTNAHGAVYEGSIPGRFGDRKPPSSAYADLAPILYLDRHGTWVGGNFWDGRATGAKLGNPAADQAQGPFLNPVEQALPDAACVVYRVVTAADAAYPVTYAQVWGSVSIAWPADIETVCATEGATVDLSSEDRAETMAAYDRIALSIAAFEGSVESDAFTSKFDLTYQGGAKLDKLEQRGFALFMGKGGCAACHPATGKSALFTDFTYDNLGVPANPENPVYDVDPAFVDEGLGAYLRAAGYPEEIWEAEVGKVKVPTLRNVDLRPSDSALKAYGHNGYFKSLEGIVHFYNTRDVLPTCPGAYTEAQALAADCWPAPEVADNVNTDELGDLGLTSDDEAAIVAFLRTLSDGYLP